MNQLMILEIYLKSWLQQKISKIEKKTLGHGND